MNEKVKHDVVPPSLFTWNSCEELDSVSVSMETELSVSHGAVWDECPRCHFVTAVITVDANRASWLVTCCHGYLVGC